MQSVLACILSLALVFAPMRGAAQARAEAKLSLREAAGIPFDRVVQPEFRRGEYQLAWQDRTYEADLPSAYHAPNLRIYFTPAGIRLIPRVFESAHSPGLSIL